MFTQGLIFLCETWWYWYLICVNNEQTCFIQVRRQLHCRPTSMLFLRMLLQNEAWLLVFRAGILTAGSLSRWWTWCGCGPRWRSCPPSAPGPSESTRTRSEAFPCNLKTTEEHLESLWRFLPGIYQVYTKCISCWGIYQVNTWYIPVYTWYIRLDLKRQFSLV
jgi:hypothetical protein